MNRIAFLFVAFIVLVAVATPANGDSSSPTRVPKIKLSNSSSTNWSGYAVPVSQVTDVVGTWTVPQLAGCGTTAAPSASTNLPTDAASRNANGNANGRNKTSGATSYSSMWVGIDGDNSNTVEQIGTEQDCVNGTTPRYYAWYEMYPKMPVNLDTTTYPVVPNDRITAEVKYVGSNQFQLSLTSSRWSKTYTAPLQTLSSAARSSAEWIIEAPWMGRVLPLANFGTTGFAGAQANINNSGLKPISNWSDYERITMVTKNGTIKAQPSDLGGSGDNFTVTWYHN